MKLLNKSIFCSSEKTKKPMLFSAQEIAELLSTIPELIGLDISIDENTKDKVEFIIGDNVFTILEVKDR